MNPSVRRERIVELLREHERLSVDALAAQLAISRETVRRDLAQLAARGQVRKVHGGAVLAEGRREGAFATRLTDAVEQKRAVAQAAAALFSPGDTLFVDVGTTTLMFAEELARQGGLTVITNGPELARTLGVGDIKVFLIGGQYRADTGETTGGLATSQITGFYASHAVITVGGLSATGAMDFQLDEAEIARAMIAQAAHLTVIADSSKLGRLALFQVCPLARIDRLVVDRPPLGALANALDEAGVEVVVAAGQP